MTLKARKNLVKVGKQLGTLTQEDIDFIMCEDNDEIACSRRMTTARIRSMEAEYKKAHPVKRPTKPFISPVQLAYH